MKGFLADHSKGKEIREGAFSTVKEVKEKIEEVGEDLVTDSTLGVLFDEEGKMAIFASIWDGYDGLGRHQKAGYAESVIGNKGFLDAVEKWIFQGIEKDFYARVIASAGGSGAISNTIWNYLDEGETLIMPEICWGAYSLMAQEFSLKVGRYSLFDEKNTFNLKSFFEIAEEVMEREGKVFAIINDPCHNPTGYSMSRSEWKKLIEGVNNLSEKGPVVILNDIAYLDFSFKSLREAREYMEVFNNISERVFVVQSFSLSKSFTCYGLRVGAQIGISKDQEVLEEFRRANEFSCRAKWSNISNGGMDVLTHIVDNHDLMRDYAEERDGFIGLMRERSEVFLKESRIHNLPLYNYVEGFFITVAVDKNIIDSVYEGLKDKNIYTIKQPMGIRIALCSLPKRKVAGLAQRIKEVIDQKKSGESSLERVV